MTAHSNLRKTVATLSLLLFVPAATLTVVIRMYFGGPPPGPQQSLPTAISTIMSSGRLADHSFVEATLGIKFEGFQSIAGSKEIAGHSVLGIYRHAVGMAPGNLEIESSAVTYTVFEPIASSGENFQAALNFFIARDCLTRPDLETALGALTKVQQIGDRSGTRYGTSRPGKTTTYAGFRFGRSCLEEVDLSEE